MGIPQEGSSGVFFREVITAVHVDRPSIITIVLITGGWDRWVTTAIIAWPTTTAFVAFLIARAKGRSESDSEPERGAEQEGLALVDNMGVEQVG
ncbi:hypothetical protein PanWU01x14_293670 [Parasponia andersonii]|uniref:Uncharacterized protein n=1 Tax=Parasponia andersonii TaxID=3476 RepID=A0A2P5AWL9_PARAD|nr:hypothetical protein PanWU01x14_293670 [Parasponia andersonii]